MIAGVPGTGIGGLYYVLLAMWMPLREVWMILAGRSSLARWKGITVQVSLAGGVVGALWAEFWAIRKCVGFVHDNVAQGQMAQRTIESGMAVAPVLAAAPFIVLGMMVAGLHVLRLFVGPGRKDGAAEDERPDVRESDHPMGSAAAVSQSDVAA